MNKYGSMELYVDARTRTTRKEKSARRRFWRK